VPRNTRIDNATWSPRETRINGKVNKEKNPQYMDEYQQFVNNLNSSKYMNDFKQGSIKEAETTVDFDLSKTMARVPRRTTSTR